MLEVVIIMVIVAVYQVPALIRQQQYRELLVFSLLWVIALAYAAAVAADVPLPTVVESIKVVYSYLGLEGLELSSVCWWVII